jgi:hypothetical protein
MTDRGERNSLKKTARIAGILILVITVFAPFSMMYVPNRIIVPGDAGATAGNLVAYEGLFRLGLVSDSIVFLIEIAIVVLLYVLLKPVSKTLSLIAAFSRLAMTVIQGINLINSFVALQLLSGAGYLNVFEPDQLHALVLLFLTVHESVVLVWGLFFSLHLFFLGCLVYKSGYIPRILGVVLVIAGVFYLVPHLGIFLFPKYEEIFSTISMISVIELALPIWLVIRGIRDQTPAERSTD